MARHGRLPTKLRGAKLASNKPSTLCRRAERQGFSGPLCPSDCTESGAEKSTKAYSNYETEGSVKGSRRTIAYQVRFEDVDDAYDGMCQGTLEAPNPFLTSIPNSSNASWSRGSLPSASTREKGLLQRMQWHHCRCLWSSKAFGQHRLSSPHLSEAQDIPRPLMTRARTRLEKAPECHRCRS